MIPWDQVAHYILCLIVLGLAWSLRRESYRAQSDLVAFFEKREDEVWKRAQFETDKAVERAYVAKSVRTAQRPMVPVSTAAGNRTQSPAADFAKNGLR